MSRGDSPREVLRLNIAREMLAALVRSGDWRQGDVKFASIEALSLADELLKTWEGSAPLAMPQRPCAEPTCESREEHHAGPHFRKQRTSRGEVIAWNRDRPPLEPEAAEAWLASFDPKPKPAQQLDRGRLAQLLKEVEWSGVRDDRSCCPWCQRHRSPADLRGPADLHFEYCRAFTPEGTVR